MREEDLITRKGSFDQRAEIGSGLEKNMPDIRTRVMYRFGESRDELDENNRSASNRNESSCTACPMSGNPHPVSSGVPTRDRDIV